MAATAGGVGTGVPTPVTSTIIGKFGPTAVIVTVSPAPAAITSADARALVLIALLTSATVVASSKSITIPLIIIVLAIGGAKTYPVKSIVHTSVTPFPLFTTFKNLL